MMSISALAMIHTQVDKVLISKMLHLGALGVYSVAYNCAARAPVVSGAISQAVFPRFAALVAGGDKVGVKAGFGRVQDLVCVASVPPLAAVSFFAVPLFNFLFDEATAWTLLLPVTLLCIGFYMNGALAVPYVLSLAMGRAEISARANFLALFTVLPVTALLIYTGGLEGAGLSWIVYHVFAWSYVVPRICAQCLDIHPRAWFRRVLGVLLLAELTYGSVWIAVAWVDAYSLEVLAIAFLLASVLFLVFVYRLGGPELRETVRLVLERCGIPVSMNRAGASTARTV